MLRLFNWALKQLMDEVRSLIKIVQIEKGDMSMMIYGGQVSL
jgi:hypothetical protein